MEDYMGAYLNFTTSFENVMWANILFTKSFNAYTMHNLFPITPKIPANLEVILLLYIILNINNNLLYL